MVDAIAALADLRPLHPPPAMEGATAILVMTLFGCAAAVVCYLIVVYGVGRRPLRRKALEALAASRRLPGAERLATQAAILRDIVKSLAGSDDARLRGDAWLHRLDAAFRTRYFSSGRGAIFGDALYRRQPDHVVGALDEALERLFARIER